MIPDRFAFIERLPCRARLLLGILSVGATAESLHAQGVLTERSAVAAEQFDESVTAAGFGSVASALTSPLRWANADIRPHFSYQYLYGDGIHSGPGQEKKTSVHTLSPGVAVELGSRWNADYTASKTIYSSDAFRDRLNQFARINGGANYGDIAFNLSYRFSDSESPLAETAEQTPLRSHQATLGGAYSLGDRTGLTSSVSFTTRSAARGRPGYDEWSFIEGLQYQIAPNLRAGVNVGFGFTYLEEGADMSYVRPNFTLGWQATEKISLGTSVGWEERSFDDSDVSDRGSPRYSGSLAYRPLETTTLVLTGSQGVSVSFFRDQITENRNWSLSLQQRLLRHFTLGVTYSWRTVEFEATRGGLSVFREDDSNSFSVRLGTRILERGSIGISFQRSNYDSNSASFAYDSEQFGAEFGYRF